MNDHTFYDAAFFAEQERPSLRKQVNQAIDRLWATTGKPHSLLWRKAYLALEETSGFRVPDIKRRLDSVEKAGLMEQLLEVVKSLSGEDRDHACKVKKAIPDYINYQSDRSRWMTNGICQSGGCGDKAIPEYVPYESDRSRWETTGISSCQHEWGVFSTVLEDVALLVQCVECGAYGKVCDPTAEEWQQAFHAPSNPYRWPDNDRVELLPGRQENESMRHIRRRSRVA